jgi:hypothetical protein
LVARDRDEEAALLAEDIRKGSLKAAAGSGWFLLVVRRASGKPLKAKAA